MGSLHRGRLHELLKLAAKAQTKVLFLQGTRWTLTGQLRIDDWQVFSAGAAQGFDGVMVCVRSTACFRSQVHLAGRLLEVRGVLHGCPVVMISAYAPGDHLPGLRKDSLLEDA